MDYYKPKTL